MSNSSAIQTVQGTVSNNTSVTDNSLNKWIFERVKPFVTGKILQLNDTIELFSHSLFQSNSLVEITKLEATQLLSEDNDLVTNFDTLITLTPFLPDWNSQIIISNYAKTLKKNGHAVLCLPVHTALYNGLDQGFRRWKRDNISFIKLLIQSYFELTKIRFFIVTSNATQVFQVAGKYRERVNIFSPEEAMGFNRTGLFALVLAEKK